MKTFFSNKPFLCLAALTVGIVGEIKADAQPDGTPLWTNRYDGPDNGIDNALSMAVDGSGNTFVTGFSYHSSGVNPDFATIKYSSAGMPLWTNYYNGPGNSYDFPYAIAVDGDGNVFVTGLSRGGSSDDYATIAYSSGGVPLWTNRYDGPGGASDLARGIAVDSSGNVIVTGFSTGTSSGHDYTTIKYSGAGVPQWTNRYNGPGNATDETYAVAATGNGNVIVTGFSRGSITGDDYATIAYSGKGVSLWTNRYDCINVLDQAHAVAVDGGGNVFVAGASFGSGSSSDYATIKYSGAGVPLWTNRYGGPGNSFDSATGAALDGSGNLFVTGFSAGSGTGYDYVTIKYSGAGVPLWTNRYDGPGNANDHARAIAVEGSGNVFVTGSSIGNGSSSDYATIKYSGAGVPLWTNRYSGLSDGDDQANAIAVDSWGKAFVTGYSWNGSNNDYVTIKYSSLGGPLLTITRTPTNMVALSWPSPAADFTLQQNTNVVSTNWTAVGITPADDGTNKTVIVDPPEGNRFYRLFRP